MDEKIIARMNEMAPLNLAKATEIAEEFDVKPRAVIASAVRQGIPYQKKAKVAKNGKPVVRKEDLVKQFAENIGIDAEVVESLAKANKQALEAIVEATNMEAEEE